MLPWEKERRDAEVDKAEKEFESFKNAGCSEKDAYGMALARMHGRTLRREAAEIGQGFALALVVLGIPVVILGGMLLIIANIMCADGC